MLTPADGADSAWLATYDRGLELNRAPAHWAPTLIEGPGCRVLFDGILHNSAELRTQFGDRFPREPSDAELVGQAYHAWGEDAVRHLRGVFALVIADVAQDLLLCARDPAGVHSLFFAEVGSRILLSPSIETLLGCPDVSAELNRFTFVARLTRRWLAPDETYFTRIRRVMPGHVMRIRGSERRAYRYWNPMPADGPIESISDDEAPERFEALLGQAVARALALGPAGIFLSGGLDSSMLAMTAADQCRREGWAPPWRLSLLFSLSDLDEVALQRGIATQLGLPQVQVPCEDAAGPRGTFAEALEMTRTMPAPLALIWRPALQGLALQGRERGCRVILAGDGADEWLWENPIQAADMLRSLDVRGLHRMWRVYARSYHFSRREAFRIVVWESGVMEMARHAWRAAALRLGGRRLVTRRWRTPPGKGTGSPSWVAPDSALRAQVAQRFEESYVRRASEARTGSYYFRDTRARLDSGERCFRNEENFLVGRRTGVPVREPYWDPDLVDFLVRVGPKARNAGDRAKALVRRPLARRFPELGFEHQRKGWMGSAVLSVLVTQSGAARKAVGSPRVLEELGVVDGRQLDRLLDEALAGKVSRWLLLWAWDVLMLETWARARR
jgi:asparagine synthase (glutamine-hydrolysing)